MVWLMVTCAGDRVEITKVTGGDSFATIFGKCTSKPRHNSSVTRDLFASALLVVRSHSV